jgi:hypothetical protein
MLVAHALLLQSCIAQDIQELGQYQIYKDSH